MTLFIAYCVALAAAMAISLPTALARGDWALVRCALALLANWVIGMAISLFWSDAWPSNIVLDAATAYIVLRKPAGKWQAALGVTYCIQIMAHLGYGVRILLGIGADAMEYYNNLTAIAFFQLFLLGGWSGGRAVALWWFDRRGPARGSAAPDPRHSGVAEP